MKTMRGLTLVELLVATALGLAVVLAALTLYLSSARDSRVHKEQARVTADATSVMAFLGAHLKMAGFGTPRINAQGTNLTTRHYAGPAVLGCDGGFRDVRNAGEPACMGGTGPDGLVIYSELDQDSAAVSSTGVPLDCRGQPLNARGVPEHLITGLGPEVFYLSEMRIYYEGDATGPGRLLCAGNGGMDAFSTSAVLVNGVVDFQITYLVRTPDGRQVIADADQVAAIHPTATVSWANVLAADLCMVISSSEEVLDSPSPYRGCNGAIATPPDRRLYKLVRSSFALRNQIASGL